MNIDLLTKTAGILVFVVSLVTFVISRLERRANLEFSLGNGYSSDFEDLSNRDEALSDVDEQCPGYQTINITITNIGGSSLLVDLTSLSISCNGEIFEVWEVEHLGTEKKEVLIKPNDSQTIGVSIKDFAYTLKIETPVRYDDSTFYKEFPLGISVRNHKGRKFSTKKWKYWESVGEFIRA